MTRPTVVYHLDITPPPQAADPEWTPEGWEEFWAGRIGSPDYEPEWAPPFRLPSRRNFFSKAAAEKWAGRMRAWGCTADVTPSDPVTWPQEVLR